MRKPQSRFHMVKNEPTRTVASCTAGVMLTAMMPKKVWMQKLRYRYRKNQKNCGTRGSGGEVGGEVGVEVQEGPKELQYEGWWGEI